jgi:hypothetical protein
MALRIVSRWRSSGAHFIEDGGCRISRHDRNGNDAPTCSLDLFPADNLIAGPVAAFDEHVRKQRADDFAWSWLVENNDGVHTFERGKNFRALEFRKNRTAGAFEFADASVAVDPDNERITKRASLLEALNVAWVKQVEAAVRKDDDAPIAFLAAKPQNHFLHAENARMQKLSPRSDGKFA